MSTRASTKRVSPTKNGLVGQPRRVNQEYTYGTAKVVDVPIKKFFTEDVAYQRALNEPKIESIGRNYDPDRFGLPVVRLLDNGLYEVIDGQNRVEYARRQGWDFVTCQVVIRKTIEEAAELYVNLREDQRALMPPDTFKGRLVQRAPWAIELDKSLTDRGLIVSGSKQPNAVPMGTMRAVYRRTGTVKFNRVLDVILAAWPEDESRRFGASIVTGIETFLYEKNKSADQDRLVRALSGVTAQRLEALGDQRWHGWRMIDTRGGNKPAAVAEEIQKMYLKTRAEA